MKTRKRILAAILTGAMLVTTMSTPVAAAENEAEANVNADVDLSQKEAPMLAEQVAAGELPPLEERLPVASDVMVEPDVLSLGNYGGSVTLRMGDDARWNIGPYTEQIMFRFKSDGSGEVEANVCKSYSHNEDYTVWTIEMREGMKWSDGEPFTADDVIFYYDHLSTPALKEDRSAVPVDAEGYVQLLSGDCGRCKLLGRV